MSGAAVSGAGAAAWPGLVPAGEECFVAESAEGVHVTGADGRRYLCADSGLWNVPLGYGNAAVAAAVSGALASSSYLPLFRASHTLAEEAARALLARTGGRYSRVVFATSGGAANDAVQKLVRHYWALRGQERRVIVGLVGSYHGLTYGSHALSGDDLLQGVYGVDRRAVRHVPFDDGGARLAALLEREGGRIGALVLEPVLGTGAAVLPPEFLAAVAELRSRFGFLLVADEVATGYHRTGPFFASEAWTPAPELLVASKALTNGSCAAAVVLVGSAVVEAFDSAGAVFVQAETQAGTPPSCAAILATLAEVDRLGIPTRAAVLAGRLDGLIAGLLELPGVVHASGAGCFRALHVRHPDGSTLDPAEVLALVGAVREAGALVHPGPSALQLVPALVYEPGHLLELGRCLRLALGRLAAGEVRRAR